MLSDGHPLPDLAEAAVLHELGLLLTDELPDVASRWLAADVLDTESVRELAGESRSDIWAIDRLLHDAIEESGTVVPNVAEEQEKVALAWVTGVWHQDNDTRFAIATLARLGETHLDFDLGFFIGLEDELQGGWGRSAPELITDAVEELSRLADSSSV